MARIEQVDMDVLLLDLKMPDVDGIEVFKALRDNHYDCKVIVLSMHDETQLLNYLMNEGVHGYLYKNSEWEEVMHCIEEVYTHGRYFAPEQLNRFFQSNSPHGQVPSFQKEAFTSRECEIMYYIASGLTTVEIADKLYLSKRTIEGHLQRMMDKLDVKNTAELVAMVIKGKYCTEKWSEMGFVPIDF